MARYIVLFNWTDQGIKSTKDSLQRVHDSTAAFKPMGVNVESLYWTEGQYDLVGVFTATDEKSMIAAMLKLGAMGNVRTQLARAYDEQDMTQILQKLG